MSNKVKYCKDFKMEAVRRFRNGEPAKKISEEMGFNYTYIYLWNRKTETKEICETCEQLTNYKKEVERLSIEINVLKDVIKMLKNE